ncbi:surfactant protein C-like [Ambystoma mexicanum]|uniref:surfactant protein C-like n=1 Tax=Ambystoma mexicanum TaxID=8296 RepID=UPI0037E91BDC
METGSKMDLVESPPVYSISPKGWTPEKRKKVVIISVVVVVLSLIAVAAILIGVKMTQDHTEHIFQTAFKNQDGSETQQTGTINSQENVATFQVMGTNYTATVIYDYTNSLIAVRMNSAVCFLTKMDKTKIPSLESISQSFQSLQSSRSSSTPPNISYTVQREEVVDRSVLGRSINTLCTTVPTYWAQESTGAQSRAVYDCVIVAYEYRVINGTLYLILYLRCVLRV